MTRSDFVDEMEALIDRVRDLSDEPVCNLENEICTIADLFDDLVSELAYVENVTDECVALVKVE